MNPYYDNSDMDMDQLIELLKRDPNYIDSEYSKKYEFLLEPSSKSSTPGIRRKVNKRVLEHLLKGADFHNKRLLENIQQASSEKLDQTVDDFQANVDKRTKQNLIEKERRKRPRLDIIHEILLSEQNKNPLKTQQSKISDQDHLHSHSETKREELENGSSKSIHPRRHHKEHDEERKYRSSRTRSRSPERRSSRSSRHETHRDRKRYASSHSEKSRHKDGRERRSRRHDEYESRRRKKTDSNLDRRKIHDESVNALSRQILEDLPDSLDKSTDLSKNRSRRQKDNKNSTVVKEDSTISKITSFDLSTEDNKNHTAGVLSSEMPLITKGRGSTNPDEVNNRFSQEYNPKNDFTTSKVADIYGPSLDGAASFKFSKGSGRTLSSMLKDEPRTSDAKYSQTDNVSWPKYSKGKREWDVGK